MDSCSCIRSVRDDHLIVYYNGKIITKINDSYNRLKYGEFMGNRVSHVFDDEAKIQETYDDRIFNCFYKEESMQIRKAEELCDTIKNKNKDDYIELFKDHYYQVHKTEIISGLIKDSFGDRVKVMGDDYIIDDRFMVDSNATAHFRVRTNKRVKMTDELGNDMTKRIRKKQWEFLCIVVKTHGRGKKSIKTKIGLIELDSKLLEIIAKIIFLLRPNITDSVFVGQLPEWLSKTLKAEKEANV